MDKVKRGAAPDSCEPTLRPIRHAAPPELAEAIVFTTHGRENQQQTPHPMTPRQRLLCALRRQTPDRLSVTTHHVMPAFLESHLGGISAGEYPDPLQGEIGFLESRRVSSPEWHVESEDCSEGARRLTRYRFVTPRSELSMVIEDAGYTARVREPLIKQQQDIDVIGEFATAPKCDVAEVDRAAEEMGERGIVRGHICCFDVFGQPGCWQDACCLAGTEAMILATYDDPQWVHEFLGILQRSEERVVG